MQDGKGHFESEATEFDAKLTNGIFDGRFVNFSFKNIDPSKYHYGHMILELSGDTETLSGCYLGVGIRTNKVVTGKIELT